MTDFEKPTWAAVVRSGQGDGDVQRQKIVDMEAKLKEENKKRDREKKELEDQKKLEDEEVERKRLLVIAERQEVLDRVKDNARQVTNDNKNWNDDIDDQENDALLLKVAGQENRQSGVQKALADADQENVSLLSVSVSKAQTQVEVAERKIVSEEDEKLDADSEHCFIDESDDSLLSKVADVDGQSSNSEALAGDRALMTAVKHRSWLESRSERNMMEAEVNLSLSLTETQELERVFGSGAAQHQLAICQISDSYLPDEMSGDKKVEEGNVDAGNSSAGDESDQDSRESTSNEVTEDKNNDDETMSEASGDESDPEMKTSTPTRGRKRLKMAGGDSTSSLSPVRDFSSDKKFKFDKSDKIPLGEEFSESADPAAAQRGEHVRQAEGSDAGGLAVRLSGQVVQIERSVGEGIEAEGSELGRPTAQTGGHVGQSERSMIVEPAAAHLERHVEQVEGSEAAQSGGHVGQITFAVDEHDEGSVGRDSSLGERVEASVGLDQHLGVSQVQLPTCKYVNCKSKRCLGKLVTRDPSDETDN